MEQIKQLSITNYSKSDIKISLNVKIASDEFKQDSPKISRINWCPKKIK